MQILGIGDHVSCGSALVRDGKVIAAINDERLVREKMVFGVPRESIRMILELHNVAPHEIDGIAVATKNQHLIDHYVDFKDGWFGLQRGGFKQLLFDVGSKASKYRDRLPILEDVYYLARQPSFAKRRRALRRIFREEFGFTCPVYFLDHHYCHATSAYYTSGYNEATVISLDGGGDGKSGRAYGVASGKFDEIAEISSFDSLGTFYSYVTQLCGFKAGRHEGKITGMAAHGEPRYIPQLQKILIQQNGHLKNVGNVFFYSALDELERLLPEDFSHRDLAASVQTYTEEMVVSLATQWLERTGFYNVALAGGLFANVKINQRIHQIPGVKSVYIHPGMSDEGMPVGAALGLYHELTDRPYAPGNRAMDHVYLGPEFGNDEIERELQRHGVQATYHDEIEKEVAQVLAQGAVVARFNGRMEYGPRALGNRTILYQANDPTVNFWLNEALTRTEFMPFAPIVMAEHAEMCFKNVQGAEDAARFMTITFQCTDWLIETNPGVVHVDNTARPQLVSEQDNPSMHRILAEYYRLTGMPVLINTSFNMHEEPIVCTPYDAIRSFKTGMLDYLAIGNWLAKNPNPIERKVDKAKLDRYLQRKGVVRKNGK